MKFLIEIVGDTQPELLRSLEECSKRLRSGGCYLYRGSVTMEPSSYITEDEFHQQHAASHPQRTMPWID
jgi:hypothetical protein